MTASFDLDRKILARLGSDRPSGATRETASAVDLQATAVLLDAELSESERLEAVGQLTVTLLGRLSVGQLGRFRLLAQEQGEAAAMSYLRRLSCRIANPVDGRACRLIRGREGRRSSRT